MVATALLLLGGALQAHAAIIEGSTPTSPNAHTLSKSQSQSPTTVSWQSAFWALVALAFNAMTQNSYLDRDFPSGILFPMRSSPIICAADTLNALLRLLVYMYNGASAPVAARRVVRERMWRSPGHREHAADADHPLPVLDRYRWVHVVVFVFGVLPQAIKLFGMRGIPWTQACGGSYLISFLVIAFVGTLARYAGDDLSTTMTRTGLRQGTMKWLMIAGMLAQFGVWVWCLWMLHLIWYLWMLHLNLKQEPTTMSMGVVMILTTLLPFVIVAPGMALYYVTERFPSASDTLETIFTFPLIIASCSGIFFILRYCFDPFEDGVVASFLSLLILAVCVYFTVILPVISSLVDGGNQGDTSNILILSFGVTNMVLAVLYYRFHYDPTGTVKPPWTDKLG